MLDQVNGQTEVTPLQAAQARLLTAAIHSDPQKMLPSAFINGLLLSVRVSALTEMVGMGSPEFQKLFDATILTHMETLAQQLEGQNVKPRIQLAAAN